MAVTKYSFETFTGNGSTTEFSLPFPFLNRSHVKVVVDGVTQALYADYTLDPSTGKVSFAVAPTSGAAITLYRLTPRGSYDRTVVFRDPSNLRAEDLNNASLQQLYIQQEEIDRRNASIRTEPADGTPSDPLEPLPESPQRAGRILAFDASGQPVVSSITLTQLQLLVELNPVALLTDVTDYGLISDSLVVASADYGTL